MRLLSPILQHVVYPALGRAGYFHSHRTRALRVLTYHGVLPRGYWMADPYLDDPLVSIEAFRSHLTLLKRHYSVISPANFLRWLRTQEELPERAVLLTCDDGLLNNLTVMVPILADEGLQCLFFTTGASARNSTQMLWYVELYLMLMESRGGFPAKQWRALQVPAIPQERFEKQRCWHDLMKRLSSLEASIREEFLREAQEWWGLRRSWQQRYFDDPALRERFQLLRQPEMRQLVAAGMTIGSHTMSHPVLSAQPTELARLEISDCRTELQQACGEAPWAIAYPFGEPSSVGKREYEMAEKAGYDCGFVNVAGHPMEASRFCLPRVHVTAGMGLGVYEAHLSGFHERLRSRFRASGSGEAALV